MPTKPHTADATLLAKIAEATHFNVHLRTGPHQKINREAKTLAEAVSIADEMGATPSGKKAMIYAIAPRDRPVVRRRRRQRCAAAD